MSESFDPYRVWLSIPPESRPPTHYQLLGISPDEQDPTVINAAVMRQSAYVRNFQVGKYAEEAARILSEIQTAKLCLLGPPKRARYDAELAERNSASVHQPSPGTAPTFHGPLAPALDIDLLATAEAQPPVYSTRGARRRSKAKSLRNAKRHGPRISWLVAAAAGLGIVISILTFALWPRHADEALPMARSEPVVATDTVEAAESGALTAAPKEPVELPPPLLAVAPFSPDDAHLHQERWASYLGRQVEETRLCPKRLTAH